VCIYIYIYSEDVSILRDKINYAEDIASNNISATDIKENCAFNKKYLKI